MNDPGDIEKPTSDDRDRDHSPAVVDEERVVDDTGADDVEDGVPVPLDVSIEVPEDDAIDQHRSVPLDDDHDEV